MLFPHTVQLSMLRLRIEMEGEELVVKDVIDFYISSLSFTVSMVPSVYMYYIQCVKYNLSHPLAVVFELIYFFCYCGCFSAWKMSWVER